MKKLGVKTDNEKTAGEGDIAVCPECGRDVEMVGQTKVCPTHGSAPFEQQDENEDNTD